ncbi:hypothetical protein OIU91_40900 (plasmid) [Streptomyces sp. NBC_01456]|uniref:hypothetical protein n=1 Tax=unclassified Streptomyces TaxID=2593676 RepID=UPI002E37C688|nr:MULTISPECIES: hypothetical protein [unclassified Streptomyces]
MHSINVTPLADSSWLRSKATDPYGRAGTVRLAYQVSTIQVAILTDLTPAPDTCPVWIQPLDLLARDGGTADFQDFRARFKEESDLKLLMLSDRACASERERQRELQDRLTPYSFAEHRLHRFLNAQLRVGDRVVDTYRGRRGTLLDPSPPPLPHISSPMIVRFDEPYVPGDPQWLKGTSTISAIGLYPTLGLL